MATTLNIVNRLDELGLLDDNEERSVQQLGAAYVETFFNNYNNNDKPDENTIANVLYFLTETQVRDYAMGLPSVIDKDVFVPALEYLVDKAPKNTKYINAPASILAMLQYEISKDVTTPIITLAFVSKNYSLGQLLYRAMRAGWSPDTFVQMREELHPLVTKHIFGGAA